MPELRLGICWVARALVLAVVHGSRNPARLWVASEASQSAPSDDVAFHPHVVPPQAQFHLKLIFRATPEKVDEQRVKFVGRGQSCQAASIPSLTFLDAAPECTTTTSAEWQVVPNGLPSASDMSQFDLCYCAGGCSSNARFVRAVGFLQVVEGASMPSPQPCPRGALRMGIDSGSRQEGELEVVGLAKQVQGLAGKVQQIQAAQQGATKQLSKELQGLEGDAGQVGHLKAAVKDVQTQVEAMRSKLDERVAIDAHRVEDFKAMLHSVLPSVALKNASASLEAKGKELKTDYSDVSAEEKSWSTQILDSTKETESEVRGVLSAQHNLEQHVAQLRNKSHALEARMQAQSQGVAWHVSGLVKRITGVEEKQSQRDAALTAEINKQAEEINKQAAEIGTLRKDLADVRRQRSADLHTMRRKQKMQQEQEQEAELKEQQEEANAEQLNATVHQQEIDFENLQHQQLQQQQEEAISEAQHEQQAQHVQQLRSEQRDTQQMKVENQQQQQDQNDVVDVDVTVEPQSASERQMPFHEGLTEEESAGIEAARQLLKGQPQSDEKLTEKLPKAGTNRPKSSRKRSKDDVLRLADDAIAKADKELSDLAPEVHVTSRASATESSPGSVQVSKRVQDKASHLRKLWSRRQQRKQHYNMAQKIQPRPRGSPAQQGEIKLDDSPSWAFGEPAWLSEMPSEPEV